MNYVYILRCADGTFYSGWTNDLTRRLASHNGAKTGAKYTRSRRPVTLVHCETFDTQSEAMQREAAIKALTREQKEALAAETAGVGGEFLEIIDTQGVVRGVMPRAVVHACSLRHRVAHLLVCQMRDGVPGVWLQQRGFDRPTLPGAYDWTATGHLDPGETPATGALREAREEVGIRLSAEQLVSAGEMHFKVQRGEHHFEDEISHLFLHFAQETPDFVPGDEVVRMAWASVRDIEAAYQSAAPLPLRLMDGTEEIVDAALLSPIRAAWNRVKKLCRNAVRPCAG